MKEIGKLLKEKREKLQLSYSDVYKVTKIQEKYLKAIEDGDTTVFFALVYYKSFVRSYSKFVGFEPEEIISMINLKQEQGILKNEVGKVDTKSNNCKNSNDIKKVLIILGILLAVILVVLIIFFYKKALNIDPEYKNFEAVKSVEDRDTVYDKGEKLSVDQAKDYVVRVEEGKSKKECRQKHEIDTMLVENRQQIENSASPNKQQEIEIIANETVWIRLNKDGRTIYEGNLDKGQRKVWEADKSFTLKVGYAPGLKVFFNGQEIDIVKNAVQDVNTVVLE
jgi:cytoskeletal protein RodZ